MSSSPRADARTRPGHLLHPSRWTLRARLLAGLIAVVALACLAMSLVTTVALRKVWLDQLDGQLDRAAMRSMGAITHPTPAGDALDDDPHQAEQTLIVLSKGGTVTAAEIYGTPVTLTAAQAQTITGLTTNGKPVTVDLGSLGQYRMVAQQFPGSDVNVATGLPTTQYRQSTSQLLLVELLVTVSVLILGGLAGAVIVRRALRPLSRVVSTARKVSALPLESGEVALSVRVPDADPHTEVGQVGAAINRMLGHVERALAARHASEQRVRQFVADASHELRTPLAAIRGYAELTRRVRDEVVPPDVTHAIGRVESEAARMTTLVEDLLLLARLDSGRPLIHEPVELSRLTVDAVGDAHIADPSHVYRLDLPEEEVVVPGDEQRLHQVLANLLANARTHTPSGTIVTVTLTTTADEAVLTVRDNGPGIPANLLPDLFQRFTRADTSRSRAAGSTGLGLSIVDAVVSAHAGRVTVASTPGDTAFTVRLPLS